MSVTTVIMRVDTARAYSADRVDGMSADGTSCMWTAFAAHQRAEVVMPHRARARPRRGTRRSAMTVIMRVDTARAYSADRVDGMSADGTSCM